MDVIDGTGAVYAGPSFADLSQASAASGVSIPDQPAANTSAFSVDYWKTKAAEFQTTLNALDDGYYAAQIALNSPELLALDSTLYDDMTAQLAEFESKKTVLRVTAEAINGGAYVVNKLGGTFPTLNVPSTLGVPIVLPLAAIAAFGVAATLISWGNTWLTGVNQRLARAQQLAAVSNDPAATSAAVAAMQKADAAVALSDGSPFSSISTVIKWAAIAAAAYMLFKAVGGVDGAKRHLSRLSD